MVNHNNVPNHLINETSPYLLAHAYNPVNWYPWSDEAFAKAKAENKLIFLSIGYHACHWCHVMESESFEDLEVANILNSNFISIKVDREERKDIDAIYMKACQMITGTGGWPLNLWLTPDKLPVYAGTYFPKKSVLNRTGLIEVCNYLRDVFAKEPNKIFNQSFQIITELKRGENQKHAKLSDNIIDETIDALRANYDVKYGGFSKAPKFPTPQQNLFLLSAEHEEDRQMALDTLEAMAKGGIYDHIGGGFSRYSVDKQWLIPHFEKMLYDNGLALDAYSKAYKVSGSHNFKIITEEIISFLEKEMLSPEGGFYSAYDADSEGVEGKYYRYLVKDILDVLGEEDGERFCKLYDISPKGNFEGFSIPNLIGKNLDILCDDSVKGMKVKLYQNRVLRVKPALDDKVLSMSNGFAIHGLSESYQQIESSLALELAFKSYHYIKKYMMTSKGELLASVRNNKGTILGSIEDYGAVIRGFFKLYDVTLDDNVLIDGLHLLDKAIELFEDDEHGGFFVGSKESEGLIYNPKELYDGATPSGNSMMAMNLLKAYLLTEEVNYKKLLDEMIDGFSDKLNQYKQYTSYFMMVIQMLRRGTKELKVYVPDEDMKENYIHWARKHSQSYTVTRVIIDANKCIDEKPTVYRCQNGACELPKVINEENLNKEQ